MDNPLKLQPRGALQYTIDAFDCPSCHGKHIGLYAYATDTPYHVSACCPRYPNKMLVFDYQNNEMRMVEKQISS